MNEPQSTVAVNQVDPPSSSKHPRLAEMLRILILEKAAIENELAPFREFHDQHSNDPQWLAAKQAIRASNSRLAPIAQEIAALTRALGPTKSLRVPVGEYGG